MEKDLGLYEILSADIRPYDKSTAPRAVKVGMRYMGEPIWVSSRMYSSDASPRLNSDLWMFQLPPATAHMFNCYKAAWQAAHESKHLGLSSLGDLEGLDVKTKMAIESSLNTLGRECERLLEEWVDEQGWETVVHKQTSFV